MAGRRSRLRPYDAAMHRIALVPDDAPALGVRTLLDLAPKDRAALRAGSVTLAPGQRVPAEG